MKATIYHLGISVPPILTSTYYKVVHAPIIKVNYHSHVDPRRINEFLKMEPIVLILSQNGVRGLKLWMEHCGLKSDYFNGMKFWTVGERTHECLQKELNIISSYPNEMTGSGVISALHLSETSQILLVSGEELRADFISSLKISRINYYQFPVYKAQVVKNDLIQSSFHDSSDHYLVFTSPSTVDGFLQNLGRQDLRNMSTYFISIRPTTSNCISDKGGNIFIESQSPNINNLYRQLSKLIKT